MSFEEEKNTIVDDENKVLDSETKEGLDGEDNIVDNKEKVENNVDSDDWLSQGEVYVVEPTDSQIRMAQNSSAVEKTTKGVNKVRKVIRIILNVIQPVCFVATIAFGVLTLGLGVFSMLTAFQSFGDTIEYYFVITLVLIGLDFVLMIVRFICSDLKTNIFNIMNIITMVLLFKCHRNIIVDLLQLMLVILLIYYNVVPEKWKTKKIKED